MLSAIYFDVVVCNDTRKKLEIIKYYNSMKRGIDRMEGMLGRYITYRQTNLWLLAYCIYFFNIIDVSSLAVYIIHYVNNKIIQKKIANAKYSCTN